MELGSSRLGWRFSLSNTCKPQCMGIPAPTAFREVQPGGIRLCVVQYRTPGQGLLLLSAGCCWMLLTCFTVHSKVLLALQHTVDYPGTAPICGVISIRCHHLHHRGACSRDKNKNKVREEMRRAAQTLGPGSWQDRRVGANTDHSHILMKASRTAVCKGSTTSLPKD